MMKPEPSDPPRRVLGLAAAAAVRHRRAEAAEEFLEAGGSCWFADLDRLLGGDVDDRGLEPRARSAKLIGAPGRGVAAAMVPGAFCAVWAPTGPTVSVAAVPPSSRAAVMPKT
jgi:hypothetical protein